MSHVHVRSEHPRGAYAARVLRRFALAFVPQLAPGAELSILVVTDRAIQKLNRDWRQKDKPTDVLSFEQDRQSGLLGDVVVSLDTARRQAKEGGRPLTDELARLLAHGLLHLLGHDHERPADAKKMAKAEIQLLGKVGLVGEAHGHHPAELEFTRVRRAPRARRSPQPSRRTARRASEARP